MSVITTNGQIPFSKHRNTKSKSLDVRDMAGNKINGSIEGHFKQINQKVQARYDLKKEAFNLLSIDEIKDIYNNPVKPTISSNTDKSALADVYFDKKYQIYDVLSIEELEAIQESDLDVVEKIAKNRCLELKQLKNKIQNKESETLS